MAHVPDSVEQLYRERAGRFARLSDVCARRSRLLSHVRLIVFFSAGSALVWTLEPGGSVASRLLLAAALGLGFLGLVLYQNEVDRRCRWNAGLSTLNREGLARLARDWEALPPERHSFDGEHPAFASDLDLFGTASLFTLLDTVATAPGAVALHDWLLEPAPKRTADERQVAVAELAPLLDLRQQVTLSGRAISGETPTSVTQFLEWAEGEPWLAGRAWVTWTARGLTLGTVALIALNIAGVVPYLAWLAAASVNLAFTFTVGKPIHSIFERAFARESAFQRYAEMLRLASTAALTAPRLQELQREMTGDGVPAHRQMTRLHRLMSLAEVHLSMPYVAIQAFTLWDFHVLARLEKWQRACGRQTRRWVAALAEFDALAALAGLYFDNPGWTFPEIAADAQPLVVARALGHPLLPDAVRVANDVSIGPPGSFLFITGSNMSGKSTLLRAVGMNVALARAGGPVCASSMRLPPIRLETAMRVHDSLQAGLSHFMAELERLKQIVSAARQAAADPLLYLLDDIFQGTNTAERRIAARMVISHLLAAGAIGAVTSHDLALADTEELSGRADPVHFTECLEETPGGPKVTFDYELRPGIATSRNAIKLLEMIGLDPRSGATVDRHPTESSTDRD